MKKIIIIIICSIGIGAAAQQPINVGLKQQLDSMMIRDQQYRALMSLSADSTRKDSLAKEYKVSAKDLDMQLWQFQSKIDSSNLAAVEQIIRQYGYPGKTLVGEPANEAAWYVIQHSQKIPQYFPLIEKAAKDKELPFTLYAMMYDRLLMEQGKEQVYGTQGRCQPMKNGVFECFIWPIADPATVNERRKAAGFPLTVEKNAERMNMKYRVVKMSEVQ